MKKLNQILFSLLTFLIFSTLLNSAEKTIFGNVNVIDGDTIKINKKKIRLFGIDAPEKKQICQKFTKLDKIIENDFLENSQNY